MFPGDPRRDAVLERLNGAVQIWVCSTSAETRPGDSFWSVLNPAEQERAGRFRLQPSRDSFVITRAVLRGWLGQYLGLDPGEIEFAYGPKDKPRLASPTPLHFNVSHSGGLSILAFTCGEEVGVDVEPVRALPDWEEIAQRFFCRGEAEDIRLSGGEERTPAFFRCWTRKEAYVKATGEGFSTPLDGFRVSVRTGEPVGIAFLDPSRDAPNWNLHDIDVGPEFAAAVAYAGVRREVSVFGIFGAGELEEILRRTPPER